MKAAFNRETNTMKVTAENMEDLWHLNRVIEAGDIVHGRSFRRFKQDEGDSGEKKAVNIELNVERTEFSKHGNYLRVTGVIKAGTPEEFVQIGSYHTLDVEENRQFTLVKKEWKEWQVELLKQAVHETKRPKIAIVVMDEESALFASLHSYGVDFHFEIERKGSKRDENYEEKRKGYYAEVMQKLDELKAPKIIVAGPGFAKENLKKLINEKNPALGKKIAYENCSNAEKSGVYELLKSGAIEKVAGEERMQKEVMLIEKLVAEMGRESGLAVYGLKEVGQALEYSAVQDLLVTDELLRSNKEVEKLAEKAQRNKVKLAIFSTENDTGKQLKGLSGVAALLRFKIR